MITHPIIIKYLVRRFSWYFFLVSLVTIVVFFISNAFDILQKFKSTYVSPEDFWLLIFLKIPSLYNKIAGIIGFISALLFLKYMVSSRELLIIVASGVPVWRVFAVLIAVSFIFGSVIVAIINPIGAFGLREVHKIEGRLSNLPPDNFVIAHSGIFFYEKYQGTNRIIQARSIDQAQKVISNITIFIVDSKNELLERIDASSAILENGQFELADPDIFYQKNHQKLKKMFLPTNLSIANLIKKFRLPEMVSFWSLPELIDEISNSGLPILQYQLAFFKELFKPITMSAMVLVACWFLSLNTRDNSNTRNITIALVIGFVTYFLLEIILRILAYGGVGPIFATLLPIIFVILISNFVILHFQEA